MKKSCDLMKFPTFQTAQKGKMASSLLSVVHFVSKSTRPEYTPEDDADYDLCVLSIGDTFHSVSGTQTDESQGLHKRG